MRKVGTRIGTTTAYIHRCEIPNLRYRLLRTARGAGLQLKVSSRVHFSSEKAPMTGQTQHLNEKLKNLGFVPGNRHETVV
jgi:hypothetical protein